MCLPSLPEKGFCMRGDMCPFDHGSDPVVVEDVNLPNMLPFQPPPIPGGEAPPPPGPPPPLMNPPPVNLRPPGLPPGSLPPGSLPPSLPPVAGRNSNGIMKIPTASLLRYLLPWNVKCPHFFHNS